MFAPLLLFLIITYIFPIGEMFTRSVDDRMVTNMLPKTFKAMENGMEKNFLQKKFLSILSDYKILLKKKHGKLGQRLNKEKNGFNTILKKLLDRKKKKFDEGNAKRTNNGNS